MWTAGRCLVLTQDVLPGQLVLYLPPSSLMHCRTLRPHLPPGLVGGGGGGPPTASSAAASPRAAQKAGSGAGSEANGQGKGKGKGKGQGKAHAASLSLRAEEQSADPLLPNTALIPLYLALYRSFTSSITSAASSSAAAAAAPSASASASAETLPPAFAHWREFLDSLPRAFPTLPLCWRRFARICEEEEEEEEAEHERKGAGRTALQDGQGGGNSNPSDSDDSSSRTKKQDTDFKARLTSLLARLSSSSFLPPRSREVLLPELEARYEADLARARAAYERDREGWARGLMRRYGGDEDEDKDGSDEPSPSAASAVDYPCRWLLPTRLREADYLPAWLSVNTRCLFLPLGLRAHDENFTLAPLLDMANHTLDTAAPAPAPVPPPSGSFSSGSGSGSGGEDGSGGSGWAGRPEFKCVWTPKGGMCVHAPGIGVARRWADLLPPGAGEGKGKEEEEKRHPWAGLARGDEVCITYGAHGNAALLQEYGFVMGFPSSSPPAPSSPSSDPSASSMSEPSAPAPGAGKLDAGNTYTDVWLDAVLLEEIARIEASMCASASASAHGAAGLLPTQVLQEAGYWREWTLHKSLGDGYASYRTLVAVRLLALYPAPGEYDVSDDSIDRGEKGQQQGRGQPTSDLRELGLEQNDALPRWRKMLDGLVPEMTRAVERRAVGLLRRLCARELQARRAHRSSSAGAGGAAAALHEEVMQLFPDNDDDDDYEEEVKKEEEAPRRVARALGLDRGALLAAIGMVDALWEEEQALLQDVHDKLVDADAFPF